MYTIVSTDTDDGGYLFIRILGVLPEKARLDTAGAIRVNLRETCILLSIEFKSFPSLYLREVQAAGFKRPLRFTV